MSEPPPLKNPYIVGRPVTGENFYGREEVFSFACEVLTAPGLNSVVLSGQRRSGKTSILRELPHRLPPEEFQPIFFDLQTQARFNPDEIIYNLAQAIAESFNISPPAKANFNDNPDYFRKDFLPQVRLLLGGKRLLLLFDEFEAPSENIDTEKRLKAQQEFYPYIGQLFEESLLAFVFVVSRPMDTLAGCIQRIFKGTQGREIQLLPQEEAIALAIQPAKDYLTYEPGAIQAILDLTAGHPYFTQLICFELFRYAKKHQVNTVTAADVEAVISSALESGEPAFTWIWEAISAPGRIYLAVIAYLKTEQKAITAANIEDALLKFKLKGELNWSYIEHELENSKILSRNSQGEVEFVVKLMERWVSQARTLRDIKAALLQEGSADYEAAQAEIRKGKFDLAADILRNLLYTNPNHLRAQLTLADILLEQKNFLADAINVYETAFWLDEGAARGGLIRALLALAQTYEPQDSAADTYYRRVFELDPNQYRVQEKLEVLYKQGSKAEDSENWQQAVASFERINKINPNYKDAPARYKQVQRRLRDTRPIRIRQRTLKDGMVWLADWITLRRNFLKASLVILIVLIIGGWVTLPGLFTPPTATPTVTQVIVQVDKSPTPTQSLLPPPPTLTPTSTATPTPTPTFAPTVTPIQTVSPTSTLTPTQAITSTPLSPSPTQTVAPTIIVVTATPTPTPTSPSFPQPKLIAPSDTFHFTGRNWQPRLEWEQIQRLGPFDYYSVRIKFKGGVTGSIIWVGGETKETTWIVSQQHFDEAAGPNKDFTWFVVVTYFPGGTVPNDRTGIPEPAGKGIEASPHSEERTFRWD